MNRPSWLKGSALWLLFATPYCQLFQLFGPFWTKIRLYLGLHTMVLGSQEQRDSRVGGYVVTVRWEKAGFMPWAWCELWSCYLECVQFKTQKLLTSGIFHLIFQVWLTAKNWKWGAKRKIREGGRWQPSGGAGKETKRLWLGRKGVSCARTSACHRGLCSQW